MTWRSRRHRDVCVEAWWRVSETFEEQELSEFGGEAAGWLTTLVEEPPEGL